MNRLEKCKWSTRGSRIFKVFPLGSISYLPLKLLVIPNSVTPMDCIAHQAPLSVEFSRQEYWSGLLFPAAGDLPDPGIKSSSPALAGGFFTIVSPGKSVALMLHVLNMNLSQGLLPSFLLFCQHFLLKWISLTRTDLATDSQVHIAISNPSFKHQSYFSN